MNHIINFNRLKRLIKFWVPYGLLNAYREAYWNKRMNIVTNGKKPVSYLLPKINLSELFPGIDTKSVYFPVSEIFNYDYMILPHKEQLAIGAICREIEPDKVFEIGTYKGSTTLIFALNTPSKTKITTLDLDPLKRETHLYGTGIDSLDSLDVGSAFKGTIYEKKILQLYGDSTTFDFGPYNRKMDLVYIDADHTYGYVKNDTRNALSLIKKGGVIVWDDYVYNDKHPECSGVTRCLNELSQSHKCYQLAGTRLAIHVNTVSSQLE